MVAQEPPLDSDQSQQQRRGRKEERQVKVYAASSEVKEQWPGLRWFIAVKRSGQRQRQAYERMSYYISSYPQAKAVVLAEAIRGHWAIENRLHWEKDVTLNEDGCGIRQGQGAENLSLLKNMAINVARKNGFSSIKAATMAFANKVEKMVKLLRT